MEEICLFTTIISHATSPPWPYRIPEYMISTCTKFGYDGLEDMTRLNYRMMKQKELRLLLGTQDQHRWTEIIIQENFYTGDYRRPPSSPQGITSSSKQTTLPNRATEKKEYELNAIKILDISCMNTFFPYDLFVQTPLDVWLYSIIKWPMKCLNY